MPWVTQTTAWCGLRPVANALGCCGGREVDRRHRLARPLGEVADDGVELRGVRVSLTGFARAEATASLSLNQYEPPTEREPDHEADDQARLPEEATRSSMNNPPNAARRTNVLIVFLLMHLATRVGAARRSPARNLGPDGTQRALRSGHRDGRRRRRLAGSRARPAIVPVVPAADRARHPDGAAVRTYAGGGDRRDREAIE